MLNSSVLSKIAIDHDSKQSSPMIEIKIECFGAIERLLPSDLSLQTQSGMTISDVLDDLICRYPKAESLLDRCACAIGEDIIPRQTLLESDSTVVLLSPVAGG
ncbi:MAG: hypothetical protein GAK29_00627 [Acinetobacter bereziniae]|uniref:MoaD/ThiS family protein n=1 Tax=Acinetobacter bereziniae TaxID=106648 RepID=A0A833U0V5_ACIBZ|nr:MAG: hypothetical protein GAK29_00627 [Acinetobacter bereziniae]